MKTHPPIALLHFVLMFVLAALTSPAFGATFTVLMNNFSFSPAVVNIKVGDTVTWSNQAGSHTATGTGSDPICGNGTIPVSQSVTFNTVGTFPYICIPHAGFGMAGSVVVAAGNLRPTISFTSPTNGTKILAGSSRNLDVTTADADGTVARVDYFASETAGTLGDPVGFTTAAPFQLPVSGIPAGTFFLTAVATDNLGATNASAVIQLFSLTNATLVPLFPLTSVATFTVSNSFNAQQYFVDALTNFTGTHATNWFPIATNTAPSNDFIFTDTVLTAPIQRLYRVRQSL